MDWHPFIVHYPIAFLSLSPLCDIGALWLGRRAGHHLAYGLLVFGRTSSDSRRSQRQRSRGQGLGWASR